MDKSIRDQCIELRKAVYAAEAYMMKWGRRNAYEACDLFQLADTEDEVSFTALKSVVDSRGADLQNISIVPMDLYCDGHGIFIVTYTNDTLTYWKGELATVEKELQMFKLSKSQDNLEKERRDYERLKKKFEG